VNIPVSVFVRESRRHALGGQAAAPAYPCRQ
jgi:hypothetical protein